jgi:CAAX protease family protein
MRFLSEKLKRSPDLARIGPFAVFVLLTALQGQLGEGSQYWVYIFKTGVGAWLVWETRAYVLELRWAWSWEAIGVGVAIFVVWVGLDGLYPRLVHLGAGWNPAKQYGPGALASFCIAGRIAGSSLVVPPLEEVFYRSFMYRYFVKGDFLSVPIGEYHPLSFFGTSILFGLMHPDRWLAGIICGVAYQWLVVRKKRLGDAMLAHGLTNLLLGLWVAWKGQWNFW